MKKYSGLNIRFSVDGMVFYALNASHERFLRCIPMHSHSANSYEIHFISSGYGTAKVGEEILDMKPGTLYVTGPHVLHEQIPYPDDPMTEYCVYLRVAGKQTKRDNRQSAFTAAFLDTPFWIGQDRQDISPVMKQLFNELEQKHPGYLDQAEALLKQLIVYLVRNYTSTGIPVTLREGTGRVDDQFLRIEEYFLYGYHNARLDDLAAKLGISTRQTQRLLRQFYGKTFQEKKSEATVSAALMLLKDPSCTITQIAEKLGYSSSEHFSNAFRRHLGDSPSGYRKNIPGQSHKVERKNKTKKIG